MPCHYVTVAVIFTPNPTMLSSSTDLCMYVCTVLLWHLMCDDLYHGRVCVCVYVCDVLSENVCLQGKSGSCCPTLHIVRAFLIRQLSSPFSRILSHPMRRRLSYNYPGIPDDNNIHGHPLTPTALRVWSGLLK